jgi:hypothetical protein
MSKHLRIEFSSNENTAVIGIETARNDDCVGVTVECPPDAVPEFILGLKAALIAMEKISEQASLPGLLN